MFRSADGKAVTMDEIISRISNLKQKINEESGTSFDPKCVEAFLDSADDIRKVMEYYQRLE